jgi:hypothetical protein
MKYIGSMVIVIQHLEKLEDDINEFICNNSQINSGSAR